MAFGQKESTGYAWRRRESFTPAQRRPTWSAARFMVAKECSCNAARGMAFSTSKTRVARSYEKSLTFPALRAKHLSLSTCKRCLLPLSKEKPRRELGNCVGFGVCHFVHLNIKMRGTTQVAAWDQTSCPKNQTKLGSISQFFVYYLLLIAFDCPTSLSNFQFDA